MLGSDRSFPTLVISLVLLTVALAGCAAPGGGADQASACLDNLESGSDDASMMTASGDPLSLSPADTVTSQAQDLQQNLTGEPIKIGTLLPLTGTLSNFGPDMEAAVQLAAEDINNAGGIGGRPVEIVTGDSQTDPAQAPQELNRLIQEGVVAVVGAASSGVTKSVRAQAVDNNIALVTPASTAPGLTQEENNGLFFRVPPNDALQGKVMAQILEEDGVETVSTLFVNNDYGQGFNDILVDEFTGEVLDEVAFDDKAQTFDSELSQVASSDPDAIVYVGYTGNGVPIMRSAHGAGIIQDAPFYFSEGVFSSSFPTDVGQTEDGTYVLAGCKGTTPEILLGSGTDTFQERFNETYGHAPGLFAAQSYDATAAIALGIAASSDDPAEFKQAMPDMWNSPGQKISDLGQAITLAQTGADLDWAGPSGDFQWNEDNEPARGIYAIWQVNEDGGLDIIERGIEKQL